MILPDGNLLLYACDQSSPFHPKAVAWCEQLMSRPAPVILLPVAGFGFVRISTHSRSVAEVLQSNGMKLEQGVDQGVGQGGRSLAHLEGV